MLYNISGQVKLSSCRTLCSREHQQHPLAALHSIPEVEHHLFVQEETHHRHSFDNNTDSAFNIGLSAEIPIFTSGLKVRVVWFESRPLTKALIIVFYVSEITLS